MTFNLASLQTQLAAADSVIVSCWGMLPAQDDPGPNFAWYQRTEGWIRVTWSSPPTQTQITNAGNIVAAFNPAVFGPRSILAIISGGDGLASLNALTTTQKTNIWNDFSTNKRWLTDTGENQAVMLLAVGLFNDGIIAAASVNAKLWIVACYAQDNPSYLVTPAFDASINVPGQIQIG